MPQTAAPPFPTELHKGESPEIFIAGGRIVLASAVLAAVWIAPSAARFAAATHAFAASYCALSLIVLFAAVTGSFKWLIFVADFIDLVFPASMALLAGGTKSPFYVLYVWVVFAASVRWGIKQAVVTAGICAGLVLGGLSLLSAADFRTLVRAEYDPSGLLLASTYYLAALAAILYVAEKQKRIRRAALLVTRLITNARIDVGMTRSLQAILTELLLTFGAQEAIVVCRDHQTSQTVLLRVVDPEEKATWQQISSAQAAQFFELAASSSSAEPAMTNQPWVAYMKRSQVPSWRLMFGEARTKVLLANISGFPDWDIELFLLDPRIRGYAALWLLQRIVVDIVPTIYNLYLVRRLRSRAKALERSRLAHELHDGTLQSLFAMRLQLKALHRLHVLPPQIGKDIDRVEQLLRAEMIQLRGLMQRMSDPTVEPEALVKTLAECVSKFERDSDLHTSFICDSPVINLPNETCRELVRITQEALVNIQKHSGAHNVVVEFRAMQGIHLLAIEDDGVGFNFNGRFTAAELNRLQKGPRMIKRRAESIGAQLIISSNPGRGCRLEIVLIPATARAEAHA